MSVHTLSVQIDGNPMHLQMGWDTPMQWYYLVIENEKGSDLFYSNLDDESPNVGSLDYFLALLESWNISVPPRMILEIENDRKNSRMNRHVNWDRK